MELVNPKINENEEDTNGLNIKREHYYISGD